MHLLVYFSDGGLPLRVGLEISYDYQAKQWIEDTLRTTCATAFKWELCDDEGTRCVWEREPGSTVMPTLSEWTERYTGTK
ncbi:hypothetical protein HGA64_02360 [Candidatus Falkowbacteria bacterium]|nr:hypothetical protein [Candidatus Falkowbacteria bacterium]